ncbi:MAG TPA: ComEC family competence protein, partial [Caldilineae bacterium]|nr:ComEC family competence protein [Caldilineae bacterium]
MFTKRLAIVFHLSETICMDSHRTERFASPFLPIYAALGLAIGVLWGERLHANGIFVCNGARLQPDPLWLLLPLPFLLLLAWWGRNRRRVLIPALLLLLALVGAWRYTTRPFEPCFGPDDLATYNSDNPYGRPSVLEGVIVGYPDQRSNYNQYRVRVDTRWEGAHKRSVEGVALVRGDKETLYEYGDRIRIRGVAATPPTFPDFDYRRFLVRKGIHTLIKRADITFLASDQGHPFWAALYSVRARASAILDQLMSQPYAALANGMILGIESGIPRELYDDFNLTGTSHVIVISGSNIAIVSGILLGLFLRLFGRRKRIAVLVTIGGIILYALLVGADAAVTRAALMGILFVIAVGLGRQSTAIISLFVAAIIMFLLNPLTVWDVGFQLSFMATLGLILFSQPLQRAWDARIGKRIPKIANNLLAEALLVTVAAQITTMPLVVFYFGRLSLISFLANLLIIPVQPPIMIAGGLAIFAGFVFSPLAKLIALVPYASLWWTVFVVEKMAAVPWGSLEVSAFGRLLAALYYLLFGLGFMWWLLRQEQGETALMPA